METFRITQVSYSSKFCQYLASIDDPYLIQISSWWLQRWCSSSSTLSIFQIDPWHFTVSRSPPFFVFHSFIGTQSYIVYSLQRLLVLCLNILVPKLFSVWLVGAPSCWFLCPCKVRWGNRNPHTPFMGVENRAATLVNSLTVLQASKHRVSVWPAILLLGTHIWEKRKHILHKKLCKMFTAALFIRAIRCKQPKYPTD